MDEINREEKNGAGQNGNGSGTQTGSGQNREGTPYGTSNGLFGQTDRDSGEYRFRNGHTQQVYSNAHYIPEKESTVPPRYYRPSSAGHEPAEKRQASEKIKKKSAGTGFVMVLVLCFLCALVGGAASCMLILYTTGFGDLSASVLFLTDEDSGEVTAAAGTEELPAPDSMENTLSGGEGRDSEPPELSAREIYAIACSQVVSITTDIVNYDIYGNQTPSTVSGSGFFISSDGYILTNYHVVEYAVEAGISVGVAVWDGSVYVGSIMGRDEDRDLAVVKIEKDGFSPVSFGDSDQISVGDPVYAVGNPYGVLEYTMSAGHVSALNRMISTDENEDNACSMFQIDAAVFSGNSGGPVYNTKGEVVGIVSARYSEEGMEGIGFAIPVNDAVSIARELLEKGYVSGKASISAVFDQRYNEVYSRYYRLPEGAYVYSVNDGGSAENAGIEPGDIIMQIGDYSISGYSDVSSALRHYKAGDTASVTLYRNSTVFTVTVVFDEYIPEPVGNSISAYATKDT